MTIILSKEYRYLKLKTTVGAFGDGGNWYNTDWIDSLIYSIPPYFSHGWSGTSLQSSGGGYQQEIQNSR